MSAYGINDLVRVKADGGTFAGAPVLIRAVVPRVDLLGNIYIVHPPKEPNNKREIPHRRIDELIEPNPLPPSGTNPADRIMLHVPVRGGTNQKVIPMPAAATDPIPPLTLDDTLDPIAKAEAIRNWMQTYDRKCDEAAKELSVSRATIDNYMFLLKATDELKERIRTRRITMYKAIAEMRAAPKTAPEDRPAPTTAQPATIAPVPPGASAIATGPVEAALAGQPAPALPGECATTNLERITGLLEAAENEIRRLHHHLETGAPMTLNITINGGTFHIYGEIPQSR